MKIESPLLCFSFCSPIPRCHNWVIRMYAMHKTPTFARNWASRLYPAYKTPTFAEFGREDW